MGQNGLALEFSRTLHGTVMLDWSWDCRLSVFFPLQLPTMESEGTGRTRCEPGVVGQKHILAQRTHLFSVLKQGRGL